MTDPMITAANTLEASPKPSYGPHKASERYLDTEDEVALDNFLYDLGIEVSSLASDAPVPTVLQALETLRTHLRKKYYGG